MRKENNLEAIKTFYKEVRIPQLNALIWSLDTSKETIKNEENIQKYIKEYTQAVQLVYGIDAQYTPHFRVTYKNQTILVSQYIPFIEQGVISASPHISEEAKTFDLTFLGNLDSILGKHPRETAFEEDFREESQPDEESQSYFEGHYEEYDEADEDEEEDGYFETTILFSPDIQPGMFLLEIYDPQTGEDKKLLVPNISLNFPFIIDIIEDSEYQGNKVTLTFSTQDNDNNLLTPPSSDDPHYPRLN